MTSLPLRHLVVIMLGLGWSTAEAQELRPYRLMSKVEQVQPFTGIVLWSDNDAVDTAPIQLEYAYMNYAEIVDAAGQYDWAPLEKLLDSVASRRHQLVLRWYDTYVGKTTGVPQFVTQQPGYQITKAKSEGEMTEFPDWSRDALRQFVLEFFTRFAERYDQDRRLAFLQVGFGLWSEYHIYDGPMLLGKTFPSLEFQAQFLRHLARSFKQTHWMISVDAANDWTPLASHGDNHDRANSKPDLKDKSQELLQLPFGVFDDSFNHKRHAQENEPNWNVLQRERWQRAPAGGEFSFFTSADQRKALAPTGPHGKPFMQHAADFHVSFIIGDDQPRFQAATVINRAGLACGYKFRVTQFDIAPQAARVTIENIGIAPLYYDAFPSVNGVRSAQSLQGLLPNQRRTFEIQSGGASPKLTIECDRLVLGQSIGYDASLNPANPALPSNQTNKSKPADKSKSIKPN